MIGYSWIKIPFQAIRAVLSGFVGIGKRGALERDLSALRPQHVIIAGLICSVLFVTGVIAVVKMIVN